MGNSLCFKNQRRFPRRRDEYRPTCMCPCETTNGPFHRCCETLDPYKRHHFREPRLKPVANCFELDYELKLSSEIPPVMPRLRPENSSWTRPSRYPLHKGLQLVRDPERRDFRPELRYDPQRPYVLSRNALHSTRVEPSYYFEPSQPRGDRKCEFRIKHNNAPPKRRTDVNWVDARTGDTGLKFYGPDDKESFMHPPDTPANNLHYRRTAPLSTRAYPLPPVDLSSRLNDRRRLRVDRVQHEPEFEQVRIPGSSGLSSSPQSRQSEPRSDSRRDSALSGLRRPNARVQFHEFKQVNHIYPPSLEVGLPSRRADVQRDVLLPRFPAEGDEHSHFSYSGQENSQRTRFWDLS